MTLSRRTALGLVGVAGLSALVAAALGRRRQPPAVRELASWPLPDAPLHAPELVFPPGFARRRVVIDPGHGAPGNPGNSSCYCVDEQDFTLGAANALVERLARTPHFDLRLSREGEARVDYPTRVTEAETWGADAFISLHSDVRGQFELWEPKPGLHCRKNLDAPGFSVLWSDQGSPTLNMARHRLACATARQMRKAGFLAYTGPMALYEGDPEEAGVFVDRHPMEQRIYVLHKPTLPSILIETHHALDPREAERWTEPRTLEVFAAALAAALIDALASSAPASERL